MEWGIKIGEESRDRAWLLINLSIRATPAAHGSLLAWSLLLHLFQ
jgi:hypothetical protein